MRDKPPTLIIDGSCLCYQAAFTMGDLSYRDRQTGVIFGFLSRILSLGQFYQTNEFLFCWDSKKSKRRDIFPGYKKRKLDNKQKKHRRMVKRQATKLRREILPAIGFKNQFLQSGLEADDIMAKIAYSKLGEFIIVTTDEDLFQCLLPNVRIYNPTKKKMMTVSRFKKEYGIHPFRWRSVKAIGGCSSDTVPGCRGVGEKTALKYLRGELKEDSATYRKIHDFWTKDVKEGRNLMWKLTTLPFPSTREPKLKLDRFRMDEFLAVCEEYGLLSLMRGARKKEWKRFFKGDFNENSTKTKRKK